MLPAVDMKKTGENLKTLCKDKGVQITDLKNALCVTDVAVYRWLSGARLPSYDNIVKLSAILETPIDRIIAVSETRIEWNRKS